MPLHSELQHFHHSHCRHYQTHSQRVDCLYSLLRYLPQSAVHKALVVAVGCIDINGVVVGNRDGVAIHQESKLTITALEESEIVLVDTY